MPPAQERPTFAGEVFDARAPGDGFSHHQRDSDGNTTSAGDVAGHLPGPTISAQQRTETEHSDALRQLPHMQVENLLTARRCPQPDDERGGGDARSDGDEMNAANGQRLEAAAPSQPVPQGIADRDVHQNLDKPQGSGVQEGLAPPEHLPKRQVIAGGSVSQPHEEWPDQQHEDQPWEAQPNDSGLHKMRSPVVRQLHGSEQAGEEEKCADNKESGWAQNQVKHVFDRRRKRGHIDLVVGPAPDRRVANNGMVGDDPGHEQRLEVVDRDDPWRSMPLRFTGFSGSRLCLVEPPRFQHVSVTGVLGSAASEAGLSACRRSSPIDDTVTSPCSVIAPAYPKIILGLRWMARNPD